RANIAACRAQDVTTVLAVNALAVPEGDAANLVFLDPPYRNDQLADAIDRLRAVGRLAPKALMIVETARSDPPPITAPLLAERVHGAARLSIWRED
ncbi:MAG TPA: RsmD family RNA methyltransferase, partial [Steroidobacteraceae bacterium]